LGALPAAVLRDRAQAVAREALQRIAALYEIEVRVPTEIERPLRSNLNGDSNPI
jgi:hypothetical protein